MRDIYHNVAASQPLAPVVATTTKTSAAIDLKGFDSLEVLFTVGASGDTLSGSVYWTLKLQHSDDDMSYDDVALADLQNGSATVVINSASSDETVVPFGYKGGKRYVKAVATPTGSHSNGMPIGIIALRGHAGVSPVT